MRVDAAKRAAPRGPTLGIYVIAEDPEIERPAGEPSARTWDQWMAYIDRRRERAELAGLYFQGTADSYSQAYHLTEEQLRQCVTFVRAHNNGG